ncbi:MAG: tetratricopeptide repeat protein [Bacteroidia bacterium]
MRRLSGLLFLLSLTSAAQQPRIDSLEHILSSQKEDSNKVNTALLLSNLYRKTDKTNALHYAETGLVLSTRLHWTKGFLKTLNSKAFILYKFGDTQEALRLFRIGLDSSQKTGNIALTGDYEGGISNCYSHLGETDKAIEHQEKALTICQKVSDKKGEARALMNLGILMGNKGLYDKELDCYLKALRTQESFGSKMDVANTKENIGIFFVNRMDSAKALDYMRQTLQLRHELNDKLGECTTLNNTAGIYGAFNNMPKMADYLLQSLHLAEAMGEKRSIATACGNLGEAYASMNQLPLALEYLERSMKLHEEMNDQRGEAVNLRNLAQVCMLSGQMNKAIEHAQHALKLSKQFGEKSLVYDCYRTLGELYFKAGDFKNAYESQKQYSLLKDSVNTEKSGKQIAEMQTKYETEKKQLQINDLEKTKQIQHLEITQKANDIEQQRFFLILVGISLLIACVMVFFIFRSYRQKKKANVALTAAYNIIEEKNHLVEEKSQMVEEKNKEILDSIHYAKRIQGALFAGKKLLQKNLPRHFILYKPKDIVSGDFYWAAETTSGNTAQFMLCTADCTGHGVPGAFMSLLNISLLNETVLEKQVHSPEAILGQVRERIIHSLNPEGSEATSRDGMDAILCAFDFKGGWLRFACANNPLWLIRNGELKEFQGDKMPVGIHGGTVTPFTLQTLGLRKGDCIYTFTDGYADQFGGPKGKKFKYKQLASLLLLIHQEPMEKQEEILNQTITEWKGGLEQVDDILLIGIKI